MSDPKTMKTMDQLISTAKRELAFRTRNYPTYVERGHMSSELRDHEIACMSGIVDVLSNEKTVANRESAGIVEGDNKRILLRYEEPETYLPEGEALEDPVRIGAIVDTETTGLNPVVDEIFELGVVLFEYDARGQVGAIIRAETFLRMPSVPISEEASRVTGVTTAQLEGKSFPMEDIADLFEGVSVIIAHHADFDRPFCEKMFKWAVVRPWACSLKGLPWSTEFKVPSQALQALAWWHGFYFEGAHRAHQDCLALLHLLAKPSRLADPMMPRLIESARFPVYRIWAFGSDFNVKDALKARGYQWHDGTFGKSKCWFKDCPSVEAAGDERNWLAGNAPCSPEIVEIKATKRFSRRMFE